MSKKNISEIEYKLAWEWFKYHAQQRAQIFYFYLIITGALLYGLILINSAEYFSNRAVINLLIGLLGIASSISFYILEKRNEELVNCGREVLKNKNFVPYDLDRKRKKLAIIPKEMKDYKFIKYIITHSFIFKTFIYFTGVLWFIFIVNRDMIVGLNLIVLVLAFFVLVLFFVNRGTAPEDDC